MGITGKTIVVYIGVLIGLVLGLGSTGCAPMHSEGSTKNLGGNFGLGSGICGDILKQEFSKGWQPFLKTNCGSCHVNGGGGKGSFGEDNLELAFEAFAGAGELKIADFAINPSHKPPYTGEQHQEAVNGYKTGWDEAQITFNDCLAAQQNNGGGGGGGGGGVVIPPPDGPRVGTKEIALNATNNYQARTLDLSADMIQGQQGVAGARFEVEVRTFTTPTGETNYNFRNPKVFAGGQAVEVKDIRVSINGKELAQGTTWKAVSRKVPSGQNRVVSTGTLIVETDIAAGDTFGVSFGSLGTTTFNPARFSELVAGGGTFGQSCVGCHGNTNPRAGLNVTNYQEMINYFVVIPYDPTGSLLLSRMNDANNPMPPAGLVSQAARQAIEDWILDGAPNN
ncbi:MAG: hypothetical protein H6624_10655 [Bdellovibrionaceae bacterium]|nr:hypothetical protein [Bdellovibrionales bacterium]MCB9084796.1 hypothetical protein [Pseudobdellovibrionaceae bacterium]